MKIRLLIAPAAAAALAAGACTASPGAPEVSPAPWVPVSAQLASFESCDDALEGIQDAAILAYQGWQFGGLVTTGDDAMMAEEEAAAADGTGASPQGAGDDSFSETNNAVAGVDEPDIVKTDGKLLYTVVGQALRAVDTRSAEIAAERGLDEDTWGHQLFLGDDELLLMYTKDIAAENGFYSEFRIDRLNPISLDVLDTFAMEGSLVDARLVDGEVRLAVGSQPRIEPVWETLWDEDSDAGDLAAAVRDTEIGDWLPEFSVNGEAGEVDCTEVAHPERFTGSSLSVLALPADGAWDGAAPQTVMVDGETVHGTSESLYIVHADYAWDEADAKGETEIYRFEFADGEVRPAGEAAVAGFLLNQYSLSEYDGHLRVATTEEATGRWGGCGPWGDCAFETEPAGDSEPSKSTVTVFAVGEDTLTETGSVTDLGVDERIYAVRFIGHTGYVVTFRQTDPLYTVDLSDPAEPVVTGELKITGYSGYLHPVGEDRLLGVGQEATTEGQVTGLQVSLFDTGAAEAAVLDQYYRESADSQVQWDPHAFLYWAEADIAVLPVSDWNEFDYQTGAVVLELGDETLTEAAWISHAEAANGTGDGEQYGHEVMRTVAINGLLWTVSQSGLQANELGGGYGVEAWVAF